jgi:hypothetical protein
MIRETEFFTPTGIAAGTLLIVAFFRAHNAGVTLWQFNKTWVTITLTETFF